MNPNVNVAPLLQGFFTTRLMQQKQASPTPSIPIGTPFGSC